MIVDFKQWINKELQIDEKLIRDHILDNEDKISKKIIGDNVLLFTPELFLNKYTINNSDLLFDDNLMILITVEQNKFSIEFKFKQSDDSICNFDFASSPFKSVLGLLSA